MPSQRLYWDNELVAPPAPPAYWSYSALAASRECPRRWWLQNAKYSAVTRYPARPHPAAIEGTIVHRLLEQFAHHVTQRLAAGESDYAMVRAAFPVRRQAIATLEGFCAAELADNPRVDPQLIRARVDLDACLNSFRAAAPQLWAELVQSGARAGISRSSLGVAPSKATEKWINVDSPRIRGQVDVIAKSAIVDYKTGAPNEEHWSQLRFYALLYWLAYGNAIGSLRLIYTNPSETLEQPAPTLGELARAADALREEIAVIDNLLITGAAPMARPEPGVCYHCGVRQLCDEFWSAQQQWDGEQASGREIGSQTIWRDLEVCFDVPVHLTGAGYNGWATVRSLGAATLLIGAEKTPAAFLASGARLIGARVIASANSLEVCATNETEVFWIGSKP